MTLNWFPEGPDRREGCAGLKRRYPAVAALFTPRDLAYYFHLESMYRFGRVLDDIRKVASAADAERSDIDDGLFGMQHDAHYYRTRSIRPFTLLYTELLLAIDSRPQTVVGTMDPGPLVKDAADLKTRLEKKLYNVGVTRTAGPKAAALVALAESIVRLRWEIATMAASDGPPIPEQWRVLIAAERVGWWIDETLPWLRPLAIWLVDHAEEEEEEEEETQS